MITLSELVDAGSAQVSLENRIKLLEDELSERQEQLRKLSEETLPNMMAEVGLESFTLLDGRKIEIANRYYAKLPADSYAAFTWLREQGMDGVIKTQVVMDFGKGDDEMVQRIQDVLVEMGITPTVKSTVHHMTLKALVKEQVEKGNPIPLDAFGAGSIRTSVIKK
jgi:hypothetical protein